MSALGGRAGEEGAAGGARDEGRGAGAFGAIARRALAEGLFAGLVLRVERNGGLLFEEAWGEAVAAGALGPGSSPEAMEARTVFDLASVSKLFTATAVLRLVSMGELGLGEEVRGLLSRFSGGLGLAPGLLSRLSAGLGRVDAAALLSHSSGIHYWFPFYAARAAEEGAAAEDGRAEGAAAEGAAARAAGFEEILASVLEAHPPEGKVVYSDLNFMLLGRLVEGATGLPLPEAVDSLVLKPLGLKRTSYAPRRGPGPLGPSAATEFGNRIERGMVAALGLHFGSWRDESRAIRGEADDGNCHYFFGGAAGHAGVFSDARDLCRLGRLYLEDGRVEGEAYLAPGLAAEALHDRGGERGLGFQLGATYPGGGAGHTGFTGTCLYLHPASGLSVAILANRLHVREPRDLSPFRRELASAVLAAYGA